MNLVFASGFLIPQRLCGMEYFRDLHAAFPRALFPVVPVAGTIEDRARILAAHISAAFPAGSIHVIGHSMAGLDTRFLLSRNLEGLAGPGRVLSLTTVSTPHRGSPIADLLAGPRPDLLDPRRLIFDLLDDALRVLGIPAGAILNLTTGFAESFNAQTPDVSDIGHFSYSGAGLNSFVLSVGHKYIEAVGSTPREKINDGLVSVASANWGEAVEPPWPADHLAEVGWDLDAPDLRPSFDHVAAFRRIVERLAARYN
jgi:triacylglycerol lipase